MLRLSSLLHDGLAGGAAMESLTGERGDEMLGLIFSFVLSFDTTGVSVDGVYRSY